MFTLRCDARELASGLWVLKLHLIYGSVLCYMKFPGAFLLIQVDRGHSNKPITIRTFAVVGFLFLRLLSEKQIQNLVFSSIFGPVV